MAITKADGVTVGNCQMDPLVGVDWCHFCGSRQHPVVNIHYPVNAEHPENGSRRGGPYTKLLRICRGCAEAVVRLTRER